MALVSGAFIDTSDISTNPSQNNILATSTEEIVSTSTIKRKEDIESKVKAYFSGNPVMQKIAYCESRNRQFDSNGSIMRGVVNDKDVGIFQINEKYHLSDSKKMGIDIYTVEGNMKYAKYLYENQGTAPWNSSRPCWGNTEVFALK